MTTLRLSEHPNHIDQLRLGDGRTLTVRLVAPDDGEALQRYFRKLSMVSRHNRFLGAMSELPARELDRFVHAGENDRFSVIAVMMIEGHEIIVGEARYGFEAANASFEFGISIDDRWQGQGIGTALLRNLECRAAALGATTIFGDTLRSNTAMIALARRLGFTFGRHPDDWKLVRFEKPIDPVHQEIPCASWKLVAERRMAAIM
ncbi:N-acetyltransferase family protein [Bradyrhizobium sp.]|uniref:GNAT family N-acetyltransferase n=1 Tax=Bradyrhizobium sp. TaxID=376 RepID=UPI003C6384E9